MFTVEEITLIKMYSGLTPNRQAIINSLKAVLPHLGDEEQEMYELAAGVVRKLTAMSDQIEIDLSLALDEELPEE